MLLSDLKHGKQYHYTVLDKHPILVSYRYETINYWMFDVEGEDRFILLHKQQVIKDISEI